MRTAVNTFRCVAALLVTLTVPLLSAGVPYACRLIETDTIHGRDLAAVSPAFAGLPGDASVGSAPLPGMNRVFTPPELRRVARAYGLGTDGFIDSVCFAWPLTPLTPQAIKSAIETTLAGHNPQIEIVSWSLAAAPRGELVFPLNGLSAISDKPVIWKGYVKYGTGKRFTTWVSAKVTIGESHLVLDFALRSGEALNARAIHTESYRGPLLREPALTNIQQCQDLIARRYLPAGITLTAGMFETPAEVGTGDLVTVLVESGAARIETQGVAAQSGRRGDVILVRNPKSGRSYRARIEDKGRVAVVPGGSWGLAAGDGKENDSKEKNKT